MLSARGITTEVQYERLTVREREETSCLSSATLVSSVVSTLIKPRVSDRQCDVLAAAAAADDDELSTEELMKKRTKSQRGRIVCLCHCFSSSSRSLPGGSWTLPFDRSSKYRYRRVVENRRPFRLDALTADVIEGVTISYVSSMNSDPSFVTDNSGMEPMILIRYVLHCFPSSSRGR